MYMKILIFSSWYIKKPICKNIFTQFDVNIANKKMYVLQHTFFLVSIQL